MLMVVHVVTTLRVIIKMKKHDLSRKAQISFEFIIIFSLVFTALLGFIYIINERMSELSEKQEQLVMKSLANNIFNEVVLASSVNNNYIRNFDVPVKLLGRDYKMFIDNNELSIQIIDGPDYFAPFPVEVKGTFIENIDVNTTRHCITKNKVDGIRISKNQASLETEVLEVTKGDEFIVYVSLFCIVDLKSIRVTIKYDPVQLEIIKQESKPVVTSDPEFENRVPLFDHYSLIYDYSNTGGEYINDVTGRYTYGFLGRECKSGYGDVIKLVFKVKDTADIGITSIEFDDTMDETIRMLDCATNQFTKEGLPDSKNNVNINIV